MRAIVTVVIKNLEKGKPKSVGMDILGRFSTDKDSRHKSLLIESKTVIPTQEIEDKALTLVYQHFSKYGLDYLITNNLSISRVEIIDDNPSD